VTATGVPGIVPETPLVCSWSGGKDCSQSLIWGVNMLFLMYAGLDILGVMVVKVAFTGAHCEVVDSA
jgi:hypothetical protein